MGVFQPSPVTSVNGMTGDVVIAPIGGRTITGTANQITVTNGDGVAGNPTLSLPQDIHTGATPTFGSVTVTDDAYASGWNGSSVVPTKNAVYDKIEALNADKTSIDYIASRGISLITNGQAMLGTNYNLATFTLDKVDCPTGAAGSFTVTTTGAKYVDEFIAIDPTRTYEMSFAIRQASGDGARKFYSFLAPYDSCKLQIVPIYYMEQTNTRTTLALPLNPGDTTITLTSSANWSNAVGASDHLRSVIIWNYTDTNGYAWPAGTYSRNVLRNAYADGGISGNVITLRVPWAGAAAAAGTPIGNGSDGGNYMYGASNIPGPSTWTKYGPYNYSGVHTNLTQPAVQSFPIATAFVKAGFLTNYPGAPADPTALQKFANISFVDVTASNNKLIKTGDTMTGTLTSNQIAPAADSTYTLGTSSLYWKETYTDKLFLNSTATLDGSTAGTVSVSGILKLISHFQINGFNTMTIGQGTNIVLDTTTGTKIGTATNQKLGFYNATPVVQPSATPANATDLATALTLVNDLKSKLVTLGLIA